MDKNLKLKKFKLKKYIEMSVSEKSGMLELMNAVLEDRSHRET
jgi:hypothetical protein